MQPGVASEVNYSNGERVLKSSLMPMVEKFMVKEFIIEKSEVEKSGFEKSGVEKSGVEMSCNR